jgi:putative transposase
MVQRLTSHDYRWAGWYFVTFVTHRRRRLFARVHRRELVLTPLGEIAHNIWLTVPDHRPGVSLDAFVVMPDHVHALLQFRTSSNSAGRHMDNVLGAYKSEVTRLIRLQAIGIGRIWQSGYHDWIVRNEQSLGRIRRYIGNNPGRWVRRYG